MTYEAIIDDVYLGHWRVEGIDAKTGECFVTIFSGPDARKRALDYADHLNRPEAIYSVHTPAHIAAIKMLEAADYIVYKKNAGRAVPIEPKKIHPLDLAEIWEQRAGEVMVRYANPTDIFNDYIVIDDEVYEQDVNAPRIKRGIE